MTGRTAFGEGTSCCLSAGSSPPWAGDGAIPCGALFRQTSHALPDPRHHPRLVPRRASAPRHPAPHQPGVGPDAQPGAFILTDADGKIVSSCTKPISRPPASHRCRTRSPTSTSASCASTESSTTQATVASASPTRRTSRPTTPAPPSAAFSAACSAYARTFISIARVLRRASKCPIIPRASLTKRSIRKHRPLCTEVQTGRSRAHSHLSVPLITNGVASPATRRSDGGNTKS